MTVENAPNLVDWLTLGAASIGTFLTTWTAIWTTRREDREVFDLHLDWEWFGHGPTAELPFIYIHNRSKNAITIVELSWFSGALRRRMWDYTALYNEDPSDVNFPYLIEPGSFRKLFLDDDKAYRAFSRNEKWANFFGFFGRPSLWLKVSTMRGNSKLIGGERALAWKHRPSWISGEKS